MAALTSTMPRTPGRDPAYASGRRDLLGAAAGAFALAVTAAAVATPETLPASHPDAALIRDCAAVVAREQAWRATFTDGRDGDDRPAKGYDYLHAQVTATAATTDLGNRAKLAVAVAFFEPDPPEIEALAGALLWDAVTALALTPTQLAALGCAA